MKENTRFVSKKVCVNLPSQEAVVEGCVVWEPVGEVAQVGLRHAPRPSQEGEWWEILLLCCVPRESYVKWLSGSRGSEGLGESISARTLLDFHLSVEP